MLKIIKNILKKIVSAIKQPLGENISLTRHFIVFDLSQIVCLLDSDCWTRTVWSLGLGFSQTVCSSVVFFRRFLVSGLWVVWFEFLASLAFLVDEAAPSPPPAASWDGFQGKQKIKKKINFDYFFSSLTS